MPAHDELDGLIPSGSFQMGHERPDFRVVRIHIHDIGRHTTRSVNGKEDRWRVEYSSDRVYGVPLKGHQLARSEDARRLVLDREGNPPGQEVEMFFARLMVVARN